MSITQPIGKRISVVMCTYNGASYIREQIDSILNQTYPIYELIVQDDGSTDHTCDLVKAYTEKDSRIKLFINTTQLGCDENFRTACLKATGDYIAISDQDDIWYPQKLEKQIQAIGDAVMCYSAFHKGPSLDSQLTVQQYEKSFQKEWILFIIPICGHTQLLRSDFAKDPDNWQCEPNKASISIVYDFWLTYNAWLKGKVVHITEPLNWHRIHPQSLTLYLTKKVQRPEANFLFKLTEGYARRKHFQKTEAWYSFYHKIISLTPSDSLIHQIAQLQIKPQALALLNMCWLCMKHRHKLYPKEQPTPLLPLLWRSFFYPLVFSYYFNRIQ